MKQEDTALSEKLIVFCLHFRLGLVRQCYVAADFVDEFSAQNRTGLDL